MNRIVKQYNLVEGFPDEVSTDVNILLSDGWDLNGAPFLRKTKDGQEVIVQPMIQYEKDFAGRYMTND